MPVSIRDKIAGLIALRLGSNMVPLRRAEDDAEAVKLWAIMWWAKSQPRAKSFPVKTSATFLSLSAIWLL